MIALIRLDINIKFRAFFHTFGEWHDVINWPLPSMLTNRERPVRQGGKARHSAAPRYRFLESAERAMCRVPRREPEYARYCITR